MPKATENPRRHMFRTGIRLLLACLCVTAPMGCQSDEAGKLAALNYQSGQYEAARQILLPMAKKTNGDFVLNNDRLGSTTLAQALLTEAQNAFLASYEVINSVGVNNGGRSLGAAIVSEDIKVWKGEPYERAMVNYYLGLTYYMQHDYENARAAFENALFKLRDYSDDSKSEKYQEVSSNFALGYLMLAKSWQRVGDDAKANDLFAQVVKLRPDLAQLASPQFNQDANLLLIVDYGYAPVKVTNTDGAIVGLRPKPEEAGPIYQPRVLVDNVYYSTDGFARPPVDLLALAQDRRWESIDTIRIVKTVAGSGLIVAGAVESFQGGRSSLPIGLGLIAAGALLKASSQADTRHWEMLPRTSFVIPLHVAPGTHDVSVSCGEAGTLTLHSVVVPAKGDNTYYIRMISYPGYLYYSH